MDARLVSASRCRDSVRGHGSWTHRCLAGATSSLRALGAGLPLVVGNDATMAAVAEARARPAVGALLHLVLEVGIGGALVLDGRPLQGARGLAGEFGHLPFGDPA